MWPWKDRYEIRGYTVHRQYTGTACCVLLAEEAANFYKVADNTYVMRAFFIKVSLQFMLW